MKIVSLQSAGLADIEPQIDGRIFAKPVYYEVGEGVSKLGYRITGDEPKVTEINFNYQYDVFSTYNFDTYTVHTSDGHVRVLPADKYIAEWSE